jgi:hypothetical protein
MAIALSVLFTILFFGVTVNRCAAVLVWNDDFNDGDHNGWTIEVGDYTVDDFVLRPSDDDSVIWVTSVTAVGTWTFDLYLVMPTSEVIWVEFFDVDAPSATMYLPNNSYGVGTRVGTNEIVFGKHEAGVYTQLITGPVVAGPAWFHIDVSRDAAATFHLFVDAVHQGEAVDDTFASPSYFTIFGDTECAIDTIIVDDVPIAPAAAIPGFPAEVIMIGVITALGGLLLYRRRRL